MGAETIPTIRLGLTCLKLLVKLNNPLMGAETIFTIINITRLSIATG